MSDNKKYQYRITENNDMWTAEIIRRASAKKSIVSKQKDGFKTEEDAEGWAKETLEQFLKIASNKNSRNADQRNAKPEMKWKNTSEDGDEMKPGSSG